MGLVVLILKKPKPVGTYAMNLFEIVDRQKLLRPRDYYGRFLVWKNANPEIWKQVEKYALEMARARRRFGIKAIFERVRWWCAIETNGKYEFKLNNNYTACAVRYLEKVYPELRGLFAKRRAQCDD